MDIVSRNEPGRLSAVGAAVEAAAEFALAVGMPLSFMRVTGNNSDKAGVFWGKFPIRLIQVRLAKRFKESHGRLGFGLIWLKPPDFLG